MRSAWPKPGTVMAWHSSVTCADAMRSPLAIHHDRGAVFDAALLSRRRAGIRVGESLEAFGHRDGDRGHDAFGGLIVKDGDAAHFAAARLGADDKFLQPLHPEMTKESGSSVDARRCAGAAFFSSSNSAGNAASRRRKVSISIWPCRTSSGCRCGPARSAVRASRQAEARPGCRIVDQAPAGRRLRALRRRSRVSIAESGFLAGFADDGGFSLRSSPPSSRQRLGAASVQDDRIAPVAPGSRAGRRRCAARLSWRDRLHAPVQR